MVRTIGAVHGPASVGKAVLAERLGLIGCGSAVRVLKGEAGHSGLAMPVLRTCDGRRKPGVTRSVALPLSTRKRAPGMAASGAQTWCSQHRGALTRAGGTLQLVVPGLSAESHPSRLIVAAAAEWARRAAGPGIRDVAVHLVTLA